jgi:hypothetical protein
MTEQPEGFFIHVCSVGILLVELINVANVGAASTSNVESLWSSEDQTQGCANGVLRLPFLSSHMVLYTTHHLYPPTWPWLVQIAFTVVMMQEHYVDDCIRVQLAVLPPTDNTSVFIAFVMSINWTTVPLQPRVRRKVRVCFVFAILAVQTTLETMMNPFSIHLEPLKYWKPPVAQYLYSLFTMFRRRTY